MIKYDYEGNPFGIEPKNIQVQPYNKNILSEDHFFCHSETNIKMEPKYVNQFGINPMYSKYFSVGNDSKQIGSGKMIWSLKAIEKEREWYPQTQHKNIWPGEYYYVFKAPKDTEFWCKPVIGDFNWDNLNSEIGFPYIIEPTDILCVYKCENSKYVKLPYIPTLSPTAYWGFKKTN